jgi:hypothetical protein
MFIFWLRKRMKSATYLLYRIQISTIRIICLHISEVNMSTHLHLLQGNLLRGPVWNFRYTIFHELKHPLHAVCKRPTVTWLASYTTAYNSKRLRLIYTCYHHIHCEVLSVLPDKQYQIKTFAFPTLNFPRTQSREAEHRTKMPMSMMCETILPFPYTPPQHRAYKQGRLYCISFFKVPTYCI